MNAEIINLNSDEYSDPEDFCWGGENKKKDPDKDKDKDKDENKNGCSVVPSKGEIPTGTPTGTPARTPTPSGSTDGKVGKEVKPAGGETPNPPATPSTTVCEPPRKPREHNLGCAKRRKKRMMKNRCKKKIKQKTGCKKRTRKPATRNPFFYFFLECYYKNPKRKVTEVAREAGKNWCRLSKEEQEPYRRMAKLHAHKACLKYARSLNKNRGRSKSRSKSQCKKKRKKSRCGSKKRSKSRCASKKRSASVCKKSRSRKRSRSTCKKKRSKSRCKSKKRSKSRCKSKKRSKSRCKSKKRSKSRCKSQKRSNSCKPKRKKSGCKKGCGDLGKRRKRYICNECSA